MKHRSKPREIFLISVPSLLLLSLALYWARVEAVSAPGGSRMFISKVELTPASGLSVSEGTSHYLRVTIDHPWPRPRWWGKGYPSNDEIDAFSLSEPNPHFFHFRTEKNGENVGFASGGSLTWMEGKQRQHFKAKKYRLMGSGYWKDGSLVFRHSLPLQEVPGKPELTFDGIYMVEGQPPLRLHRVIRKMSEPLQWNRSRDPGGKIKSVRATKFKAEMWSNAPPQDRCDISVVTTHAPRTDKQPRDFSLGQDNFKIIDGRGRAFSFDQNNLVFAFPSFDSTDTPTTTERRCIIEIKRSYKTHPPLTLRGKISIDGNWPLSLSLKLPPR